MKGLSTRMDVSVERWPLKVPFHITGHTFVALEAVIVQLERHGAVGRGEAAGVYYRKDDAPHMVAVVESHRSSIEAGIDRETLRRLMPPGGARNAVDCAMWDLEAKLTGKPVWRLAGLKQPEPLVTTFTAGANPPEKMAEAALAYQGARAIKLKLTGEAEDAQRVRAVREVLPDVWLGVDANQGFSRAALEALLPVLISSNVQLIEQPFPVGRETDLDGFECPIALAADESAQDSTDIPALADHFDVINIKLDKFGGLTEALTMANVARHHGLDVMVGNMTGTALSTAPALLVGQLCKVVDLDGPSFLRNDRTPGTVYANGTVWCDDSVWGGAGT
jgi:L-alanine-DL-glutamate epimerase-like enolase superfamily enzyme